MSQRTSWEYKLDVLTDVEAADKSLDEIECALNLRGKDGWELEYLYPNSGKNNANCVAVFKRPNRN